MADGKPSSCPSHSSSSSPFQPIGLYERAIPATLMPSDTNPSKFFAFSITYSIINRGWDDMAHSASDFIFLNPTQLDVEVANSSLNLNLPGGAQALATVRPLGTLFLDTQQAILARQFKTWLFSFILGKCLYQSKNGIEGYYILPLKTCHDYYSDIKASHLVDWNLVKSSIDSDIKLKNGKNYYELCKNAELKESALIEGEFLRLYNGRFTKNQLIDGIVTAAQDGMAYCIVSVLENTNVCSDHPDSNGGFPCNYIDYYREKYSYNVMFKSQPLLQARKLYRSSNYLRRRFMSQGSTCTKRMEKVNLPPETCVLHAGIKGNLWRGAVRLPSVLHHFERALLAADLRDLIGIGGFDIRSL